MDTGFLAAYVALLLLAVGPIYIGSWDSIRDIMASAVKSATSSKPSAPKESLSSSDAYMFPLIGSCVLFGLYLVFKFFEKEYVNYLLTAYFSIVGIAAMAKFLSDRTNCIGKMLKLEEFSLEAKKGKEEIFSFNFTYISFTMLLLAIVMSAFYSITKNWIFSNCFGFAFSANGIALMQMDSFKTGIILLSGLFLYDIFWVFGTEVMVSVAKNFDAPVKMLWPKSLTWWKEEKPGFTMLGLGDIVIPGIYVALCLRYDLQKYINSLPKKQKPTFEGFLKFPKTYFTVNFTFYILGLITTVVVMHTFQAAQPALLYLSPACIISSVLTAICQGELTAFLEFKTEEQETLIETLYGKPKPSKGTKSSDAKIKASAEQSKDTIENKNVVTDDDEEHEITTTRSKSKRAEPTPMASTDNASVASESSSASSGAKKRKNKKPTKKATGGSYNDDSQDGGNSGLSESQENDEDMVLVVNKKKERRLRKQSSISST